MIEPGLGPTRAAFLDRDGTLVPDPGYIRDPSLVELLPGVPEALTRLRGAGYRLIVVTNQSGIARGWISWEDYYAVAARIDRLLAAHGVALDATYVCPHFPAVTGPCACRKPGPAHYRNAAGRFGLDLTRSLWFGDRLSDLEPARATGGRGILVQTGEGRAATEQARAAGFDVAPDLGTATDLVI
jgi:histidinol-phosphate phosphatase family protein